MPKIIPTNQDDQLRNLNASFLDAIKKVEAKNDVKSATSKNPQK